MSDITKNATVAIQNWNKVRNDSTITTPVFNKGASFEIAKSMYSTWKDIFSKNKIASDKQKLHAYLGLSTPDNTGALALYTLDKHTDSLDVSSNIQSFDKSLQLISYQPELLSSTNQDNIDPKTALERINLWNLKKDSWLQEQTDMAQVLEIPFTDIQTLFETYNAKSLFCQLALAPVKDAENNDTNKLQLDLIIWGRDAEGKLMKKHPEDLIMPKPPFSHVEQSENFPHFKLLQYALY